MAPSTHPVRVAYGFTTCRLLVTEKDAGDAVGADAGKILVAIVVDDAFQSDVAALHDDADRLLHAERYFCSAGYP